MFVVVVKMSKEEDHHKHDWTSDVIPWKRDWTCSACGKCNIVRDQLCQECGTPKPLNENWRERKYCKRCGRLKIAKKK